MSAFLPTLSFVAKTRLLSPLLSRLSREQAEKNKKKLVETLQNSKYGLR
jgi:hypothetical protein